MKAIYLDNYRGFKNQTIHLRSVNFFVGENSSGKTSILAALKLLSSPELYFKPNFLVPDLPFVSFSEFVSKGSHNKKNFVLGIKTGDKSCDFKILRFGQKEGMPTIQRMFYGIGNSIACLDIAKGVSYYIYEDMSFESFSETLEFCLKRMDVQTPDEDCATGGPVEIPPGLRSQIGVGMIQQFVNVQYLESKGNPSDQDKLSALEISSCKWVAPIRAKPQRIYTDYGHSYSSEGFHVPYVLRDILQSKIKRDIKLSNLLVGYGQYSGLFEGISVKKYGEEAESPFGLNITNSSISVPINNVGYGVSQVLPVLLEAGGGSKKYVAIQQPEVHLHPRAQAALGKFLFEAASEGAKFLIETHSDFIIDRFRISQNKSSNKVDAQVVFLSRQKGECNVSTLKIGRDGSYPEDQPEEFRQFFLQEELELIRM
ncbi:AAA family ATPase [Pseudomonas sp. LF19]|uniref:AAA family ATPase n=1 Tax=Pseudomonas sp. LF19 TaxID=2899115 RepID=UPI001F301910|nr:AAA family ATPase [Pseudomonas sp. LF19]MCE5985218.1 AAA family ATPase [Pseudomonas sp. LF19]